MPEPYEATRSLQQLFELKGKVKEYKGVDYILKITLKYKGL